MKAVAEIDRTDIGVIAEEPLGRRVDIAVDRGPHDAEPALPVAEILRQPQYAVVRKRLDGHAALGRALGDPLDGTDREATGQAARDLGGPQDATGIVADPARVEQPLAGTVHDIAVHTKIENARSFDEERAPLLIERLEGREIDDGRVGFDLAEIGVHGRIDGDVRCDAVLDVRTAVVLLVALESRGRLVLQHRIRCHLEAPWSGQALEPHDVAELRHEAAARRAVQGPTHALAPVAVDVAPDGESEGVARGVSVAELGKRNPKLRGPTERVYLCRDFPDTVPRVVFLLIVTVHRVIALHTRRVHGKLKAGSPVVVGIDHDFDLITADADVAAGQKLLDAVGMRVEGSYENVEVVVVVGDLGFRGEARVRVLGRLELPEVLDDRSEAPDFVVVFPIDDRRGRSAVRHSGRRVRRRRGRWRRA